MKYFCIFLFIFLSSCAFNIGHRMGGDIIKPTPENTLETLQVLLNNHQNSPKLRYIEFDIRESKDSVIFVFHDKALKRLVPMSIYGNGDILKPLLKNNRGDILLAQLDSASISNLNLSADSIKIPTLPAVLNFIKDSGYKGRVYIEVKDLRTIAARGSLLKLVNDFKTSLRISLIAYRHNFENSFPNQKNWCNIFDTNNIKVLSIGWHGDLCTHYR